MTTLRFMIRIRTMVLLWEHQYEEGIVQRKVRLLYFIVVTLGCQWFSVLLVIHFVGCCLYMYAPNLHTGLSDLSR